MSTACGIHECLRCCSHEFNVLCPPGPVLAAISVAWKDGLYARLTYTIDFSLFRWKQDAVGS